jgi:hypothetical protein
MISRSSLTVAGVEAGFGKVSAVCIQTMVSPDHMFDHPHIWRHTCLENLRRVRKDKGQSERKHCVSFVSEPRLKCEHGPVNRINREMRIFLSTATNESQNSSKSSYVYPTSQSRRKPKLMMPMPQPIHLLLRRHPQQMIPLPQRLLSILPPQIQRQTRSCHIKQRSKAQIHIMPLLVLRSVLREIRPR